MQCTLINEQCFGHGIVHGQVPLAREQIDTRRCIGPVMLVDDVDRILVLGTLKLHGD